MSLVYGFPKAGGDYGRGINSALHHKERADYSSARIESPFVRDGEQFRDAAIADLKKRAADAVCAGMLRAWPVLCFAAGWVSANYWRSL